MSSTDATNWAHTTHRSANVSFDHLGRAVLVLAHRAPGDRLQMSRSFPLGDVRDPLSVIFARAAAITGGRLWNVPAEPGDGYVDEALSAPHTGDLVAQSLARPDGS